MSFRLPRLQKTIEIVTKDRLPNLQFQRWWQSVIGKIEAQEAAQDQIISDLAGAVADIAQAQADLAAQLLKINAVTLVNDISASWTQPSAVLTASDAGSDATITIADFMRYYDIAAVVDVTGGSITGLAYETTYAIYYDDATQEDENPAFAATTDVKTARYNYAAGRHYLGEVTTPAIGGGDTGGGPNPPGGGAIP